VIQLASENLLWQSRSISLERPCDVMEYAIPVQLKMAVSTQSPICVSAAANATTSGALPGSEPGKANRTLVSEYEQLERDLHNLRFSSFDVHLSWI